MRVAVQLRPWLIQEPVPDLVEVLPEAVKAGYAGVEIGAHYLDWQSPGPLRARLDELSLKLAGVHVGGDIFNMPNVRRVRGEIERVAACAAALGTPFLLYSGLLLERKSQAERQAELEQINTAAAVCARHGLRLLYHNHWWEIWDDFADLRFYQEQSDPALVSFCLDLGWVHRAGGDPLQAVDLFGGRVCTFHLRDDSPEERWMPLGEGNMPLVPLLLRVEQLNPAWLVIEQDDISGDITESLRANRMYLKTNFNW